MTKQELIKAIVLRRDYRFTHDELMRMNKAQLTHIYNGGDVILKVPKYQHHPYFSTYKETTKEYN